MMYDVYSDIAKWEEDRENKMLEDAFDEARKWQARAEAAERRIAELEAQLRTLEAQAAYYGCPHCGKPITLVAPPIDPPAPA